jgi:hypothetical protein
MHIGTAANRFLGHKIPPSYLKCMLFTVMEENGLRDRRKGIRGLKGRSWERRKLDGD